MEAGLPATPGQDIRRQRFFSAFWSHAGNRRGGVGVIIRKDFLKRFPHSTPDWQDDFAPGAAARLSLSGPEGDLDLLPIYMPTGNQGTEDNSLFDLWCQLRASIAKQIRPQQAAFTILAGDFNYVGLPSDRWSCADAGWMGRKDARDEKHWNETVGSAQGCCELFQPHATHATSTSRARLDKVFIVQHTAEQLDSKQSCAALDWPADQTGRLSHHRPVRFCRYGVAKRDKDSSVKPLSTKIIKQPNWPVRVALAFKEEIVNQGNEFDPLDRLFILKQAIQQVTSNMEEEAKTDAQQIIEEDDKAGWTMRCLRACQKGRWSTVRRCIAACAELAGMVEIPLFRNIDPGCLQRLRDHAVALHKAKALSEMRRIQEDSGDDNDFATQVRRDKTQQRLRLLKPGATSAIGAILGDNGKIFTAPAEIAAELRNHWKQVFSAKGIAQSTLDTWCLEELSGVAGVGLPNDWSLKPGDIEDVLRKVSKSAPGPDGIPYEVQSWPPRSFGAL